MVNMRTKIYPNKFKEQKIKTRKLRHIKGPTSQSISRKSVEALLDLNDREHFMKFYSMPPLVPTRSAECNNVMFEQAPLYIAGRYNKYMRGLPQTAWMIHDERKLETSVHELIADRVQKLTKATGSKLIASGREDVDVRMLGSGRPFALELISPRHVVLTATESKALEDKINTEAAGKVSVGHLKIIPKSAMELLKAGEEKKNKTYEAYCVAWNVDMERLAALDKEAPLTLQQKTPMRVLHRRPIATRPRTVHWMTVSDVKPSDTDGNVAWGSKPPTYVDSRGSIALAYGMEKMAGEDGIEWESAKLMEPLGFQTEGSMPADIEVAVNFDSTYFKLRVNTQAGTYVKEFVHGDFGRTRPNIGELLGGVTADCLALDVESIELDWPPE